MLDQMQTQAYNLVELEPTPIDKPDNNIASIYFHASCCQEDTRIKCQYNSLYQRY